MALPVVEEGKLLSEALNTVRIQVQQMKRHLVSPHLISIYFTCWNSVPATPWVSMR
jgi:hypothetical protein